MGSSATPEPGLVGTPQPLWCKVGSHGQGWTSVSSGHHQPGGSGVLVLHWSRVLLHMLQVNSGSTSAEPGTEDRQTGSKCPQLLLLDPAGMVALGLKKRPAPWLVISPT